MTESQFQSKLLKALRVHPALKDAVIFKHSDRFNGGVPDVSITRNNRVLWLELKVSPNRCSKLQLYYGARLRFIVVTLLLNDRVMISTLLLSIPFEEAVDEIARHFAAL